MAENTIITATELISASTDEFSYIPLDVFSDLIGLVSEVGDLRVFEDHIHTIGNLGVLFTYEKLSRSLVRRARVVGGQRAYEEIQSYLNADRLHLYRALLIHDNHIEEDYTFTNGVRLLSVENLPPSRLRDNLIKERFDTFLGGHVETVMSVDYVHKKAIRPSNDKKTDWSAMELLGEAEALLNDTRLLLSLAKSVDYGIPVVSGATVVPEKLSFLTDQGGYNAYPEPRTGFGPSIIEMEMQQADHLLQKFDRFEDVTKDRIRVPLKRLNDAKIDPNWANKAINLRICLENLFLSDGENSEISRILSERVPIHTLFSKSRTKKVYGFLSGAIHSGRTQYHPNVTEKEIAQEVQKVIRQFIEQGAYPSWDT